MKAKLLVVLVTTSFFIGCGTSPIATPKSVPCEILQRNPDVSQQRLVEGGCGNGGGVVTPPKPSQSLGTNDLMTTRFWVAINDKDANPWNTQTGKAMTWRQLGKETDLMLVGSDSSSSNAIDGTTNPYFGDTSVDTALPLLCLNVDNRPQPSNVTTSSYSGWAGGEVKLTVPVQGRALSSRAVADQTCTNEYGSGWRMAEFHDGMFQGSPSGWAFYANGSLTAVSVNARILNLEARNQILDFDPETGSLSFASLPLGLQVGNIIVSEPTKVAPYGIPPLKIASISQLGTSTLVQTTPSALDEIIDEGDADVAREVSAQDIEVVEDPDVQALSGSTMRGGKLCSIAGIGISCSFSIPTESSPVKLTGSFEIKARQQFVLKFRKILRIKEFKAAVGLDQKAKLAFQITRNEDLFQFEKQIARLKIKRWVIWIGPIPVTIEMYVKLKVGASGKVSLVTEYSIEQNAGFLYGYRYTYDKGWETINEKYFDVRTKVPNSNGTTLSGEVKAHIGAVPGIGLYAPAKIIGAEADIGSVKVYGKLNATIPGNPAFKFTAGLEFCSGFNLTLAIRLPLIKRDFKFEIAEGDCKEVPLKTLEWGGVFMNNLAPSSVVTASSSTENPSAGWKLSNVNDGKKNSVLGDSLGWSSNGDMSDPNQTQWVEFDLGSDSTIARVDLYPRNDQTFGSVIGDGFPVDFSIDVSRDGINWQSVVIRTGVATPSGVQSFVTTVPRTRFVRIRGTKLDAVASTSNFYYMQLAEVEIFGQKL